MLSDNHVDIHYKNDIYDCTFKSIDFEILDKKEYDRVLLYSIVDTNNIEIFNFIK